jgi:hypothetical protein
MMAGLVAAALQLLEHGREIDRDPFRVALDRDQV